MNVLLICSSGITTNILAAKLQKYAAQQGKDDVFKASRINQYPELLPHADVLLIAPQAALIAGSLKADAKRLGIPFRILTEPDFVLGDVEKIYAYLDTCRAAPRKSSTPIPLTLPLGGKILLNAALYSLPVLLFGLLCRLLGVLFSTPILLDASHATLSILILYFMFSLGYQYGALTNRDPVSRGMITLGAPLLMLPLGSLVEDWNAVFRVAVWHIPLSVFALPNALFLALLAVVAMLSIYQLDKLRLPAAIAALPMMESMLKMGLIALLFILLRLSLSFL